MTHKTCAMLALAAALAPAALAQNSAAARAQIRRDIETYMRSVDLADPNLAATVWLTTPDASLHQPRRPRPRLGPGLPTTSTSSSWARPSPNAI